MGFEAPGAPQTPEIDHFRPAQNSCIKNPGVLETAEIPSGRGQDPGRNGGPPGARREALTIHGGHPGARRISKGSLGAMKTL